MANQSSAEFHQLQREYRHMELNRKSYADESYAVLRKQQATIAKLRRDNETLKAELGMETRHSTMKPSGDTERHARLQEEVEKYQALVQEESHRLQYLDDQITTTKSKMVKQRKQMGGVPSGVPGGRRGERAHTLMIWHSHL